MLTRSQRPPLTIIPEVERHCCRNKQERREQMAEEQPHGGQGGGARAQPPPMQTLKDYFTPNVGVSHSIHMPEVPQGAHYQLNPQLINTTINAGQFAGLPSEDPLAHLRKFLRIADTTRFNGTPLNITRLSLLGMATELGPVGTHPNPARV